MAVPTQRLKRPVKMNPTVITTAECVNGNVIKVTVSNSQRFWSRVRRFVSLFACMHRSAFNAILREKAPVLWKVLAMLKFAL